jgi:hypothetical protein
MKKNKIIRKCKLEYYIGGKLKETILESVPYSIATSKEKELKRTTYKLGKFKKIPLKE